MKYYLTLMLFYVFYSSTAHGLTPRRHDWTKLKTPHFIIITPKGYKAFGERAAKEAERAFQTLNLITDQFPKNTMIIIDPTKDFSNGQATFFPYATITLQPAAPSPDSSIGQYDNWLYELILHEYTHILSFHNHRGLYRPLRWVLGSAVSPGYFLPVWYLEGFAVFNESYLTSGGRLRNSKYKAMQTLFANKHKKIHISKINEQDLNWFPHGQNPYFFGGWINQKSLKSTENAKKIHKKFSGRVPFFIASAYKSVTKKSIFKDWRELFNSKKTNKNELKNIGLQPKILNNKVYFIGKDLYQTDEIQEFDIETKKVKTIVRTSAKISQFKIENENLYFLSLKTRNNENQVFELYKTELNKKDQLIKKPISTMLRARNFDILSKDLIYSKIDINGDSLALTNLDAINTSKTIYSPEKPSRITFVYFINKDEILFSEKTANQEEKIFKYKISSQEKNLEFTDEHIIYVKPIKDSFYALSEKNGQKFLTNLKSKKRKEVSGRVLSFDIHQQDFWGSEITLDGPQILKMTQNSLAPEKSTFKVPPPPQNTPEVDFKIEEKKYSSLNRLKPHYIIPNFVLSPYGFSGETLYGVGTGGSDPLKLNQYSISIFTDSITNEVSGNINYLSNHFSLPISVSAGKFYEPLNLTDFRDSSYAQILTSKKLSPNSANGWTAGGGILWDETTFNTVPAKRFGLNFNLSYNSSLKRARELAPKSGLSFSVSNTYFTDLSDDYTEYFSTEASIRKFFKAPLFKSHRIMLGLDAFWSNDLLLQAYAPNSRNNPLTGGFVFRGLPTGAILANELYAVGHFEYKFPLLRFDWGPGLWPIFLKRATGAFVSDFGIVSGTNRLIGASLDTDEFLTSVGAEFNLETKISYHVPLIFQLGIYNYLDKDFYGDGPEVFVGVNLSGLPF